jgi:hypothetical protein
MAVEGEVLGVEAEVGVGGEVGFGLLKLEGAGLG